MKKTPKDIDSYIETQNEKIQPLLQKLRQTIQKAVPKAEEVISYSMPAFKFHGMLAYFAGYKHHIGFYPMPLAITTFKKELSKYKTSKGAVQFPLDKPLPVSLITKMVKARAKQNLEKEKKKPTSKK